MDIIERFLKYVSFDTQSDEESTTFPSTEKQIPLLMELKKELEELGVSATYKNGYVYGKVKSDCGKKDTLFLMAHVDTSPDASCANIKPRIVHFDGSEIKIDENKSLTIEKFECLKTHIGHDLIITDGTTLLGADDKAGVAIIVATIEKMLKRGNYPNIIACFSPDEEIGHGTKYIDVPFIKEGTDRIYAYTLDGDDIQGFSRETFNAAHARVKVTGLSIHPSIGKNKLINAQEVLMKFHSLLPNERPENTEKREPFIHMTSSHGMVEYAQADYIVRNFDAKDLERQKNDFYIARDKINEMYKSDIVEVEIYDQYRNMFEVIEKNEYVSDLAYKAFEKAGIKLIDEPIRGGTDGSALSFMGIPCPNLGTGGGNFHGVYEFADIDEMKKMVEVLEIMMDLLN